MRKSPLKPEIIGITGSLCTGTTKYAAYVLGTSSCVYTHKFALAQRDICCTFRAGTGEGL
eukprot:SAG11_NODE_1363_length_5110_cov_7.005588_1_plen_60_part_00